MSTENGDRTTYVVERFGTRHFLRVPRAWRVTFGPPGTLLGDGRFARTSGDSTAHGTHGFTLRVYEGKLQRFAITGVTSYYEQSGEVEFVEDRITNATRKDKHDDRDNPF